MSSDEWGETPVPTDPDGADPVAVAVESALTPGATEAAAEVAAWAQGMAQRAHNGWDMTFIGPAPGFPPLRLRSLRALASHAYSTGVPCDGNDCETGGAAHCHRCAEAESDGLLAERDRLRAALTEILGAFHGAYFGGGGSGGESQWMSRSQWIPTAKLDVWRALVGIEASGAPAGEPGRAHGG